jgi:plasmid stabilization system protein ParE
MSWTVIWSSSAELQLAEIHVYHTEEANTKVAKKITTGIIKAPNILLNNPELGPKEPYLSDLQIEYRYIVYKSFKIIYSIDQSESQIRIADVFDTRQNPKKLKRKK